MSNLTKTILLLAVSNCFMLCAWYFHLKQWSHRPWYIAAFLSWCIAFFEYSVHIPANRIGISVVTLPQLQIMQVGMSLLFFIPFAVFVMRRPVTLDFVWAMLCLMGAVYFIFREGTPAAETTLEEPYPVEVELQAVGRIGVENQKETR